MAVKSEWLQLDEDIFMSYDENGGSGGGDLPYGGGSLLSPLSRPMLSSPALSVALHTGKEGRGKGVRIGNNDEGNITNCNGRRRKDSHESRSSCNNLDDDSGDVNYGDDNPPMKKQYHRHTRQQLQELEALFKECPHPDDKQRLELSKRLGLETRQVKFWFQNRRTLLKAKHERHENTILRQENEKLKAENMSISEGMRNQMCTNCGGPAKIADVSLEEQHLRIENARLKDKLDRICALTGIILGRPVSLEVDVKSNELGAKNSLGEFGVGISSTLEVVPQSNRAVTTSGGGEFEKSLERSMYLELAVAAMDELVKLAQTDEPLWFKRSKEGNDVLNHEEYLRAFNPCIGLRPHGFVSEASRETGMVIINSLALVERLMDTNLWAEMFPCVVAMTTTADVISSGTGGTINGALQLMHAKLQVLSPLVPVREVKFLRYCNQHSEGVWAVVDVSIDSLCEHSPAPTFINCRRLPSGCIVQEMPNGYSKVTWVEHVEYDENVIHQLYRSFIGAGMGFGAQRWVATLQRQCECLAIITSSDVPTRDHSAITASGRRSMLKLAQRMINNFCEGVCVSKPDNWKKISANVDEDVRVMTHKSMDDPGEPPGLVLSAATSVWLPVSPMRLFDFLRDERLRSEWDILSLDGPMKEMAHIAKGHDCGNCVSLLHASAMNTNQSSMLILQETSTDAAGALVVYAPIDIPSMQMVMNGGDSSHVAFLPSGFVIVPDGLAPNVPNGEVGLAQKASGSLLTAAFQILVSNHPTANLTVESVETVNNLISCTVRKIKAALLGDN